MENLSRLTKQLIAHTPALHRNTDRLCGFDGHKAVIPLFPADVAKGSVVCDVLGDVGDLMDCMVVLEDLRRDIKLNEWSFILLRR